MTCCLHFQFSNILKMPKYYEEIDIFLCYHGIFKTCLILRMQRYLSGLGIRSQPFAQVSILRWYLACIRR